MKTTSIKAYHEIKEDGTLTKRQQEVFDYLKRNGPTTGRMVSKAIPGGHKRLSELKDMGVVIECGEEYDFTTKKNVTLWKATNNKPVKVDPRLKTTEKYDMAKVSALYDQAFRDGVKTAIDHIFPTMDYHAKQYAMDSVIAGVQE